MSDEEKNEEPVEGEIIGPGVPISPSGERPATDEEVAAEAKRKASKGKPRKKTAAELKDEETRRRREGEERAVQVWVEMAHSGGWKWRDNPNWPTEKEREQVRILSFAGYTQEQIAGAGQMSVETLVKHFDHELKYAKMMIVADLTARAIYRAREGDGDQLKFMLKTKGGFRETGPEPAATPEQSQQGQLQGDELQEKSATIVAAIKELARIQREQKRTTKESDSNSKVGEGSA